MDDIFTTLFCITTGYLLGSILGAVWVCRWFRLPDPAQSGSGNPGATNIYRIGGFLPAALTLTWDAAKGALAVMLTQALTDQEMAPLLVVIASVTGHIFPLFHRFQGGKGVATAMGASLLIAPQTTLVLIIIWATLIYWRRISSLASLTAAALAPWLAAALNPDAVELFATLALFLFIRHRENIIRLIHKRERPLE